MIGADDYITKPFTPIELVARVNAQLRRFMKFNQPKVDDNKAILEFGEIVILPNELPYLFDMCYIPVTKHELIKKTALVLVYSLQRILWSSTMEQLRLRVV